MTRDDGDGGREPMSGLTAQSERWQQRALNLAGLAAVLLGWEALVRSGLLRPVLFSSPSAIGRAAIREFARGEIWAHINLTVAEWMIGFLAAVAVGAVVGLVGGWFRMANYLLEGWIRFLYAVPAVALTPLFIIWFGVGPPFKVFLAFLLGVFPVVMNVLDGVKETSEETLKVPRAFAADQGHILATVVVPSTVPYLVTGARIAVGRSLVGVVFGELVAANRGLGFLISIAASHFDTAMVLLVISILAVFGLITGKTLGWLETRVERWRPDARAA